MYSKSSDNIKKSQKIMPDPNAAKIEISVADGDGDILKPNPLIINALGLENVKPLRNLYDGTTHFGSKRFEDKMKITPQLGLFYNDYILLQHEDQLYSPFGERHFSIAYNKGKPIRLS